MNFSESFHKDVEKLEIPNYPFFGYDDSEEINKDMDYIKGLYPSDVQKIQKEVEEECDKLEYDGSCMFDMCPDRVHLSTIVDKIYDTVSEVSEVSKEEINNMGPGPVRPPWGWGPCGNRPCPPPPPRPSHPGPPPRPDFRPDGRPDWRRNLIESLLFNEMLHRRRRHRSRKRWNNY